MIDLHEHRVFRIEPTTVHRCARKITEFASEIDVLSDTGWDAAHKGFFCLTFPLYVYV